MNNLKGKSFVDRTTNYLLYTFLVPAGAVLGAFVASCLSASKGRIPTFYFCEILNVIGSLLVKNKKSGLVLLLE